MTSTALLSVVLLLVSAGLGDMFRSAGQTEALNGTQEGLRIAWQRLYREVRYATAIGNPQQVTADAGNWHVAVALPDACVELRVNAAEQQLERRDRAAGNRWTTLATGIATVAGRPPFVRSLDGDSGHQELGLRLSPADTGTQGPTGRPGELYFVALNSSATSELPSGCGVLP